MEYFSSATVVSKYSTLWRLRLNYGVMFSRSCDYIEDSNISQRKMTHNSIIKLHWSKDAENVSMFVINVLVFIQCGKNSRLHRVASIYFRIVSWIMNAFTLIIDDVYVKLAIFYTGNPNRTTLCEGPIWNNQWFRNTLDNNATPISYPETFQSTM